MDKNSTKFLNQVAGFKIRIKELHWCAKTTAEHELCDDITDKLNTLQDKTAEELQAFYGDIQPGDTKPIMPKAVTTKEFLAELLTAIQEYYKTIENDLKFVGVKANLETYISDTNINDYLSNKAVNEVKTGHSVLVTKEQVKRAAAEKIRENMQAGANEDVTGVYSIGNNSVYVNEANAMLAVKDANKNVIFEQQGQNVANLLSLLKAQGQLMESKGGFKTVMTGWLKTQKII